MLSLFSPVSLLSRFLLTLIRKSELEKLKEKYHLKYFAFTERYIQNIGFNNVWVVFVICEYLYPISIVVFSDGCGTGSGSALSILALTDDIAAVTYRAFDEPCKRVCFRKVFVKGQAEVGQNLDVDIVYLDHKHTVADLTVIQRFTV